MGEIWFLLASIAFYPCDSRLGYLAEFEATDMSTKSYICLPRGFFPGSSAGCFRVHQKLIVLKDGKLRHSFGKGKVL